MKIHFLGYEVEVTRELLTLAGLLFLFLFGISVSIASLFGLDFGSALLAFGIVGSIVGMIAVSTRLSAILSPPREKRKNEELEQDGEYREYMSRRYDHDKEKILTHQGELEELYGGDYEGVFGQLEDAPEEELSVLNSTQK